MHGKKFANMCEIRYNRNAAKLHEEYYNAQEQDESQKSWGGAVICRERRRSRRSRTMRVPHRTERKRIGSGGIPAAGTGDAGGSKGQAGMRHSAAAKDVYRRIHNERIEENRA